ncbi:putative bifunctional diguanylate cyclase/phosphodiesterase [Paenibacillus sambharensis]|nr:EAL domain-containing protein [Paenibacillus sambharensis]
MFDTRKMNLHSRRIFYFALLVILGAAGELLRIPMIFGLNITFSSIFLLLILLLYNIRTAVAGAAVVAVISYFFGGNSSLVFLLIVEVAAVGLLLRRRRRNLFILDLQYWLFIAAPILFILYFSFNRELNAAITIYVSKSAVNGAFNALIANILLAYIPARKWINEGVYSRSRVPLGQILFQLTMAASMFPFIVFILSGSIFHTSDLDQKALQRSGAIAAYIADELNTWPQQELRALQLESIAEIGKLRDVMVKADNEPMISMGLLDQEQDILVGSQKRLTGAGEDWKLEGIVYRLAENFYIQFPDNNRTPFVVDAWKEAVYIHTSKLPVTPFSLQIRVPMQLYAADLITLYLINYVGILIFVILMSFFSIYTGRYVTGGLRKLAGITSGLPEKLHNHEKVKWPSSGVEEVSLLINNFADMSENVTRMLDESERLYQSLRIQTDKLAVSEAKMQQLAYHDVLTGLPNRLCFTSLLSTLIANHESTASDGLIGVLFMDIDRFKQINDTLGHAVGDMLLKEFGARLEAIQQERRLIHGDMTVCRLGGDEFVILMNGTSRVLMAKVAEEILEAFQRAIFLGEHELYIHTSIGISVYPDDGDSGDEIVKNADAAMYAAKGAGGRRYEFFSASMQARLIERLQLENNLHKALELEEFELFYQPRVCTATGELRGVEALIRWRQPELGIVPPDKFIPLAEETGVIHAIGEWVLRTACRQNRMWQLAGYPELVMAVNFSARQFENPNLLQLFTSILNETGMAANLLEIEITEGFLMQDKQSAAEVLRKLEAMGVRISIDDFGTGYSSLSQLKDLPLHAVKIDRSFIQNIGWDETKSSIVSAVIQLAHGMGLRVVAEGVETSKEYEHLSSINCDELQGYYFSRPLPLFDMEQILRQQQPLLGGSLKEDLV